MKNQPLACNSLRVAADFVILQKIMSVTIELDEKLVAEIDAVAKDFDKNRLQYINDSLQKILQQDKRKRKYSEEEVREMYRKAYGKFPVQPDEFEIEEEQMIEVWEDL